MGRFTKEEAGIRNVLGLQKDSSFSGGNECVELTSAGITGFSRIFKCRIYDKVLDENNTLYHKLISVGLNVC